LQLKVINANCPLQTANRNTAGKSSKNLKKSKPNKKFGLKNKDLNPLPGSSLLLIKSGSLF